MPFRNDAPLVGVDGANLTHRQHTIEVHRAMDMAVWAAHYSELKHAWADALEKNRPLVLKKGKVYGTAETLSIRNVNGPCIIGNGATLRATVDLDCLLDINGMARGVISGLRTDTADGVTVQDMIRYRWDGTVPRSSTNNTFEHVTVGGRYVNGWRIGEPGSSLQVDKTIYRQCGAGGQWQPGETTLWQRGFLVGSGVVGNNMLHTFELCDTTYNRVHYEIDRASMVVISGSSSIAEIDVLAHVYKNLVIREFRSEGARQLLKMSVGGATYGMAVSLQDVNFNSSPNADAANQPDLRWIDVNYGGALLMRNVVVRLAAEDRRGVVYGRNLQRPLYIEARGLQVVNTAQIDAFDVEGATVDCAGYFMINDAGGIAA